MDSIKIVALLLIVGGALGLAYGGFSYTRETHRADIGSLHLNMDEKERVNIPLWVGIAAVVGGAVLLVGTSRKS